MVGTKIRLRRTVYDTLAAQRGATNVDAQVQLTGVPRRTLVRVRNGEGPSVATAMRIAEAFNVPLDVLFERTKRAA